MRKQLCVLLLGTTLCARAVTIQEVYSFPASPLAIANTLTLGSDGMLYGTTVYGGNGNGSFFRLNTNGSISTLLSFAGTNGNNPQAALIQGRDGAFYGTTYFGGIGNPGYGTLFRVSTNGALNTLGFFNSTNGSFPQARLIQGSDGALYGTTATGGAGDFGTVFRFSTNGELKTLVSFAKTNGAFPYASLAQGSDGALYGTTSNGGADVDSQGTVFRVTTNGVLTTLVSFSGTNGAFPYSGVTPGNDGAFYGTTYEGGSSNLGTIFRITSNGTLTTLASFTGPNGAHPQADLSLGYDGALYGTTYAGGGQDDLGTIFSITTNGLLTTLAIFQGTNGGASYTSLTSDNHASFYGTTSDGGSLGGGNIFRVTMGTSIQQFKRIGNVASGIVVGPPGASYRIERAPSVIGPWSTFSRLTAGSNGTAPFSDATSPASGAFYRAVPP